MDLNYDIVILSRYGPQKGGGLENVVREQLKALSSEKKLRICLIFRGQQQDIKKINSKCVDNIFVIQDRISSLPVLISDLIYMLPLYLKTIKINSKIILDNFGFSLLCTFLKRNSRIILIHHGTPNYLDSYSNIKLLFTKIYKIFILKPVCVLSSKIADINVAVSNKVRNELINEYYVSPEKVIVIHNGVDIKKFKPRNKIFARKILGLPHNKKIILFVGSDLERKGFWLALKVVKTLRSHVHDILFVIVTSKKYIKKLENLKINWLKVLTNVPDDKMHYLYNAADLLLLSSKYEGLPLTLLEALASGCPAVVSPNSAEEEYNGEGYIIAYKFEEYIEYCKKLLQDDTYLKIMSKKARELAVSQYNVKKQRKKYLKLIQNF